jgi:hypothetical protein
MADQLDFACGEATRLFDIYLDRLNQFHEIKDSMNGNDTVKAGDNRCSRLCAPISTSPMTQQLGRERHTTGIASSMAVQHRGHGPAGTRKPGLIRVAERLSKDNTSELPANPSAEIR